MKRILKFAIIAGLLFYMGHAGDDCPHLDFLQNICNCSQFRVNFTGMHTGEYNDKSSTTKYSTSLYKSTNSSNSTRSYYLLGQRNGTNSSKLFPNHIAVTTAPKIRDPKYYTIVDCNMTQTTRISILRDLATILNRKWIDKLHVTHLPPDKEQRLVKLPNKWLQNIRITQFQIENSILSGDFIWNGQPFAGQKHSLVWFAATDCFLTGALTYDILGTVNLKGLEDLERLEGINLSGNHLVSVEDSAFTRHIYPQLRAIILSRNVLQKVDERAFHNISKLTLIDLSHNLLENISRNVFSAFPSKLSQINLSWNRFQSVPEDLFSNMSALERIDFSNNFLHSLPEKPWKSIWKQLTWTDISNNFLQCNCDLLWLGEYNENKKLDEKSQVRGQCGLTLPTVYVRHFDLVALKSQYLSCGDLKDSYRMYAST